MSGIGTESLVDHGNGPGIAAGEGVGPSQLRIQACRAVGKYGLHLCLGEQGRGDFRKARHVSVALALKRLRVLDRIAHGGG